MLVLHVIQSNRTIHELNRSSSGTARRPSPHPGAILQLQSVWKVRSWSKKMYCFLFYHFKANALASLDQQSRGRPCPARCCQLLPPSLCAAAAGCAHPAAVGPPPAASSDTTTRDHRKHAVHHLQQLPVHFRALSLPGFSSWAQNL